MSRPKIGSLEKSKLVFKNSKLESMSVMTMSRSGSVPGESGTRLNLPDEGSVSFSIISSQGDYKAHRRSPCRRNDRSIFFKQSEMSSQAVFLVRENVASLNTFETDEAFRQQ